MHAHLCLQALKEVETLRTQVSNYDADKMALSQGKARLSHSHKQVKNLEWENEVRATPTRVQWCSGGWVQGQEAYLHAAAMATQTSTCCRHGHPDIYMLPPWPPRHPHAAAVATQTSTCCRRGHPDIHMLPPWPPR